MKGVRDIKNYRLKYKRHFGIEFDNDFVVHHIDLNRGNNDISNLLLLPKELHAKYHLILNVLSISNGKPKADGFIDVRLSNADMPYYEAELFAQLPKVIAECRKWFLLKRYRYQKGAYECLLGGRDCGSNASKQDG